MAVTLSQTSRAMFILTKYILIVSFIHVFLASGGDSSNATTTPAPGATPDGNSTNSVNETTSGAGPSQAPANATIASISTGQTNASSPNMTNETDASTTVSPTSAPVVNNNQTAGRNQVNSTSAPNPTPSATATKPPVTTQPADSKVVIQDGKLYYNKTFASSSDYWVDIKDAFNSTEILPDMLLNVSLPFDFLFYGQTLQSATLASGGFLLLNEVNPNLTLSAITRYAAPLMANFMKSTDNGSEGEIIWGKNDSMALFNWKNLKLVPEINGTTYNQTFTFQLQLIKGGEIRFVYQNVPLPVESIPDPVKAGLSYGYLSSDQKKLSPYYDLNVLSDVASNKTIIFSPFQTCNQQKDCTSCMAGLPNFNCTWCKNLSRCFDDADRQLAEWESSCSETQDKECDIPTTSPAIPTNLTTNPTAVSTTPASGTPQSSSANSTASASSVSPTTKGCIKDKNGKCQVVKPTKPGTGKPSVGIIIGVFLLIIIVLCIGSWVLYAYRNPTTSSGMCLIQTKATCCKKGHIARSSKDYQAFMESDTESLPL